MHLTIGDRVVKNPDRWIASDFDAWGAGIGVGVIVEADAEFVDVRWPAGRCFQRRSELLLSPEPDFSPPNV